MTAAGLYKRIILSHHAKTVTTGDSLDMVNKHVTAGVDDLPCFSTLYIYMVPIQT